LTRPLQKKQERFFAEEAARFLGKSWNFGNDREHPDFVVTESGKQFGLEVTKIFMGPQSHSGSTLKAKESTTQRIVTALQREYEAIANVPLIVKFVGDMQADNLATVVSALLAQDLPSKQTGYHFVHDTSIVHHTRPRLRVHVTKGLRPNWYSVDDRVGFVDRNPHGIIATAIGKKANELMRYRNAAGDDIRLLLVADQISNSGKLLLKKGSQFDFHGFKAVYFFPYPEAVIILNNASDIYNVI
jgi:hypothetical protein